MSDIKMKISIPADNDGYVLLQCDFCGEFFKLTPVDYEDEGLFDVYCPACGLSSENFLTEDVIELALDMTQNVAMDMINNEIKKLEKQFKNSFVSFKTNKKSKPKAEIPIRAGIEALMITNFICCKRQSKIKPMLKISGCYCPFCGVKEFGLE